MDQLHPMDWSCSFLFAPSRPGKPSHPSTLCSVLLGAVDPLDGLDLDMTVCMQNALLKGYFLISHGCYPLADPALMTES
jgi:hypothetical protein